MLDGLNKFKCLSLVFSISAPKLICLLLVSIKIVHLFDILWRMLIIRLIGNSIHMILCKEFHTPVVKPISDLQRNFGSIADSRHKTKEPVYLTKNGSASLVVMNTEAYDEQTR